MQNFHPDELHKALQHVVPPKQLDMVQPGALQAGLADMAASLKQQAQQQGRAM